jgi:hypothetical protein
MLSLLERLNVITKPSFPMWKKKVVLWLNHGSIRWWQILNVSSVSLAFCHKTTGIWAQVVLTIGIIVEFSAILLFNPLVH